ncbi:flavodoxin family protein [Candidatus Bipolaricaulota bacterium]
MTDSGELKVLGIVGSPRKGGNTDLLVGELLRGAEEAGAEVERVFLPDLNINPCKGCGACYKDGEKCPQQDDMQLLIEKMSRASTWVLGTPVYFYATTAQLKTFLDRGLCVPKETYAKANVFSVIPLGDTTPDGATMAAELIKRTLMFHGANYVGGIVAHEVLDPGDVRKKPEFMQTAFEAGRKLAGRMGPSI